MGQKPRTQEAGVQLLRDFGHDINTINHRIFQCSIIVPLFLSESCFANGSSRVTYLQLLQREPFNNLKKLMLKKKKKSLWN